MVTEKGAYQYLKPDGTKGVTGSLLDNAYLLLAFVEGYDVLEKDSHLETAEQLADYSVDNLFDWYGGGFFERNSKDTDLYAPGEQLRLNKPSEENGVIAYALLKLYTQTNNPVYLYAAVTTIGNKFDSAGGLDRGYYYVKAAELINEQNLLAEVKQIDPPQNYWLDDIIAATPTGFAVSDQGLEKLEGSFILLALIALIAGMISFASPCTLPILPAYIAYTFNSSKQNIKGMTITFFLGLSVVFTLLGMTATVIGSFLKSYLSFFSQIAGLFIIFFGVYILLGKGFAGITIKQKPTSYAGSFAFGSALALSWTPCVGPILVAILVLASTTSSTITGGLLLFIYGMGLALPLVVLSSYLGKVNKEGKVWKFIQGKELHVKIGKKTFAIHTSALLSGTLFIILGFLIFSGLLFSFNQYIATSSFQKYIFSVEDWLFGLVK